MEEDVHAAHGDDHGHDHRLLGGEHGDGEPWYETVQATLEYKGADAEITAAMSTM